MPKSKELASWRESHFGELEATLKVFVAIRDDPTASNKDRIEAGKNVGRMLAAMTAPKHDPKKKPEEKKEHKPTEKEWEIINARLSAGCPSFVDGSPRTEQ